MREVEELAKNVNKGLKGFQFDRATLIERLDLMILQMSRIADVMEASASAKAKNGAKP